MKLAERRLAGKARFLSERSVAIVLIVLVGVATILLTKAASSAVSVEPEVGTRSGGSIGADASASGGQYIRFGQTQAGCTIPGGSYNGYVRPFGENAAWNIPACAVPKWASRSDDFVNRLANYANQVTLGYYSNNGVSTQMTRLDYTAEFGLIDSESISNDYSVPIYYAEDATQQVRVFLKTSFAGYNANIGGSWLESPDYNWNATVPWNPAWRGASGNDQQLVILDRNTGKEWYLWNVSRSDMEAPYNNVSECVFDIQDILRGYNQYVDLCAAAATISKTPSFQDADFRTYEGNHPAASGGGIQNYAGLVTPEEVLAGEIRHAIKFVISNTMFNGASGPCSKTLSIDDPAIGTSCGTAVAPAGQFENIGILDGTFGGRELAPGATPDERRSKTIPEGTRFVLDISDAEIETWLSGRGYTGRKRETARIFAVAMREYGLIVTDSSGGGTSIQASGGMNPVTAQKWRDLGINDNGKSLLYKLFSKEKLYVLEPAINDCGNGTTGRFYCHANKTHY